MEELVKQYKSWKVETGSDSIFDHGAFYEWVKTLNPDMLIDAFEWLEESYNDAKEFEE